MTLSIPKCKTRGTGFDVTWEEEQITLVADRLSEEKHTVTADLTVYKGIDPGKEWLGGGDRVNLNSSRAKADQAKKLAERINHYDWTGMLDQAAVLIVSEYRRGEPAFDIGKKPTNATQEYQYSPILEKGQSTTLYGAGGSGKSYIAGGIAASLQSGMGLGLGLGWSPTPCNVLLLDWESCREDWERRIWFIKKGLCLENDEETLTYRFCSQPLVSDIYAIQKLVIDRKIGLVIVDSQMAAAGYGPDAALVSSQFYNALRSLKCTSLVIDHVNKEDWKNSDSVGPYGSVVKYNRARSVFEVKKSQNAGDDFIEISLIHRKHNEGKLLNPMGIRINFVSDAGHNLESVIFESCNLADNPVLGSTLPLRVRMEASLKNGALTIGELAGQLGTTEATVKTKLYQYKELFVKADEYGKTWGLKFHE